MPALAHMQNVNNDHDGIDRSEHVPDLRDLLESTAPYALLVLDYLDAQSLADHSRREAEHERGRELIKSANQTLSECAQFESASYWQRATPAQKRENAKRRTQAEKQKERGSKLLKSSAGSPNLFPPTRIAKFATALDRDIKEFARTTRQNAEREAAVRGTPLPDDLTVAPIVRAEPVWPKITDDIDRCVLAYARNEDKRKALLIEKKKLENAPRPPEEAIAAALAEVDKLAEPPRVRQVFHFNRHEADRRHRVQPVGWPTKYDKTTDDDVIDPLKLIMWACGDTIKKKLGKLLQDSAPQSGLSLAEREKQIATLDAELTALESEECALTWHLIQAGHKVHFRPDALVSNVLGIKITMEDASFE